MLNEPNDPEIKNGQPDYRTVKLWQAEAKANKIISAIENRYMVGTSQFDRKGLENGDFRPFKPMSQKDRSAAATSQVRKLEAEQRELHLIQFSQQGQVTDLRVMKLKQRLDGVRFGIENQLLVEILV